MKIELTNPLAAMTPFRAQSPRELLDELKINFVHVPSRRKERIKEQIESWIICHFLAAVSGADLLDFPLCVEPGDKPDLTLSSKSGSTGIEITVAMSIDAGRVDAYSENKDISGPWYIPPYSPRERKRSRKEIEDIARGRILTKPSMGDSIERNWIDAMVYSVEQKTEKLAKYAIRDRYWLLIYDNWSPAVPGYHEVLKPLAQRLFNCTWKNPFEKVFIQESHHTVWEFTRDTEIVEHHVPDLFK